MKVIRDNKYSYQGIVTIEGKNFLMFAHKYFPDCLCLVNKAKYIHVKENRVEHLQV